MFNMLSENQKCLGNPQKLTLQFKCIFLRIFYNSKSQRNTHYYIQYAIYIQFSLSAYEFS